MFEAQIDELFRNISSKIAKPTQGFFEMHIDQTITIENLVNFLKKKSLLFTECRPWREADNSLHEEEKLTSEGNHESTH